MNLVKLGDLFNISSGSTPSREKNSYYEGGTIPWVKTGDLHHKYIEKTSECITDEGLMNSSTKLYPVGTILVAMYGATIGACSILKINACTNQACAAFLPNKKIDQDYLYYFFLYKKPAFIRAGVGGAQPNISAAYLKEVEISCPPLEIQKQIAAILEKADNLRKQCQQVERELNALEESIFLEMFGDPVTNPKGWKKCFYKDICRRINVGVVVQPSKYYVEYGVPALRSQNIKPNRIIKKNFVYFSDKDNIETHAKSRIFKNDVIIVRTGQPGTAAVVPDELDGVNAIDILITTPKLDIVNPYYLSAFLNSDGGKKIVSTTERGQIQKHLNVKSLSEAEIPIPPLGLQDEFLVRLKKLNDILSCNTNSMVFYENFFNSLLDRAFAGKLDISAFRTLVKDEVHYHHV